MRNNALPERDVVRQKPSAQQDPSPQQKFSAQQNFNPQQNSNAQPACLRMNQLTNHRTVSEVIIVTSPNAGRGTGRSEIPKLVESLDGLGIQVCQTSSITLLKERTTEDHHDPEHPPVVVAAGGDGTLSLVADSVPPTVPIVPMPMGTENLLARYFGHRTNSDAVVAAIQHGARQRIDAGLANGKLFLVMATCGFDAEVVRAMHLRRRGHISRFSYAGPIVRAMRRYSFPEIRISINGEDAPMEDCRWAMIFNFPCYGGHLKLQPLANGTDGKLDLMTFRRGSIMSGFYYLANVALGRHRRLRDVQQTTAESIQLDSQQRVPYQLDGDYGGHLPLRIEILRDRVLLLLPPEGSPNGR